MSTTKMTVVRPGMLTTVQDWPGRVGYWKVGVPPSGPMDDLSFRLGNVALGNSEGAPGLESAMAGPALTFDADTYVCVTGADARVRIDGTDVPQWRPVLVSAGAVLDVGPTTGAGLRVYVTVQGTIEVDDYLGSAATFTLGKFGGHRGGTLAEGDVLEVVGGAGRDGIRSIPMEHRPVLTTTWDIAVTEGPHGAPEFFTRADMDTLYATRYEVHFNSDRTGVRLIGPKPEWAREDGGEAGLHPSNIHDNAYSVGALDFTGDTPILLGPDGPSLGGFVCPVTVVAAERWKLGQLKPGDTIRFVPVKAAHAAALGALGLERRASLPVVFSAGGDGDDGVIARRDGETAVTYRRSGDDNVLVEYGDMKLDLALRARAHALHQRIEAIAPKGLLDLTPGIRSLQVKVDPDVLPITTLMGLLDEVESDLPAASELVVPSRTVRMPLSWDDPSTREAIARYMHGVRSDAPWCPWNIEFIRRMNGLDSVADVFDTVFAADYMVLGLGDVYLGAPVATPLDPRHRLVTTKYNPARTWTPENAVGIGGAYLCIYGMEGPGGYQFVGRTTQVWNHRYSGETKSTGSAPAQPGHSAGSAPASSSQFQPESPWLLRFFDRISWYPVEPEELMDLRADTAAGRGNGGVEITDGEFSLAEHDEFLAAEHESIEQFRTIQAAAFDAERAAWSAAGEFSKKEGSDAAA
ncbi:MAG: 5-oxoprolinase/urea amidolyase family protein [Rhodococcus fascians]